MINEDELAVCKRRGHDVFWGLHEGWVQCKWCGVWLREIRTMEEREDEPPEDEKSPAQRMRRTLFEEGETGSNAT